MSEFTIHTNKTDSISDSLNGYVDVLSKEGDSIGRIRKNLSNMSVNIPGLSTSLVALTMQVDRESAGMKALSTTLKAISVTYKNTEKNVSANKSTTWTLFYNEKTKDKWYEKERVKSVLHIDSGEGSIVDILKGTAKYSLGFTGPKHSDKTAFYERKREDGKKLKDEHWVRDKDGQYSIPELTEYAKKRGTVLEGKVEGSLEGSIVDISNNYKYGDTRVRVGTAEVHGSVSGGLYGYTKDGEKILAPAVNAAIGGSVCIFAAEANGKIGNDMLGLKGHAEVSAGKASGEASVNAAIFGKDGNINPQLKASASAEAIAVEAKGSVSGTIAGIEGTATGSVNFGIGAHADIGIADGKIKCDIGASMGIGASIGFEIDTTPAIKAVTSRAQAAWKALRW